MDTQRLKPSLAFYTTVLLFVCKKKQCLADCENHIFRFRQVSAHINMHAYWLTEFALGRPALNEGLLYPQFHTENKYRPLAVTTVASFNLYYQLPFKKPLGPLPYSREAATGPHIAP
jgi:hypothetical protein